MPLVTVKLIEGVFTPAQKREMVRTLTDAMVSIEGENMRPVTWVVVEEVKGGDWGIGGKSLTAADVKRVANKYLTPGRVVLSVVPLGKADQASHPESSIKVTVSPDGGHYIMDTKGK